MTTRPVTPAEAQTLLAPAAIARLRAAAFDLAETVASEPERIAAAVAAERAAIVAQIRAEAAALAGRNPTCAAYADALGAMADTLALVSQ